VEKGGKMINFCGWSMPVLYEETGVLKEVELCRNGAAIFDVSHMGQVRIWGPGRQAFMERVSCVDIAGTQLNQVKYTVINDQRGGAIDDAMVSRLPDHLHLVINSACYDKDMAHFREQLRDFPNVRLEPLYQTHAMIAIQGPRSEEVVSQLLSPVDAATLSKMTFMTRLITTLGGVENVALTRSGYTGEDGFEISIPIKHAPALVDKLSRIPGAGMAGLGSRDCLRLEAALTLYGNDMTSDINFIEAGQAWALTKRRREEGGFIGAGEILRQLKEGVKRKRVGLVIEGAPAREGAPIHDPNTKKQVGVVTSGGPSPSTGQNVALGLIPTPMAKMGSPMLVGVRGKLLAAQIVKMPFFPHRYKY
jgi:aminomethyltransferase